MSKKEWERLPGFGSQLQRNEALRISRIESLLDRMAGLTPEAQDPAVRERLRHILNHSGIDLSKR